MSFHNLLITLLSCLAYFGALLIPMIYFACKRFRGSLSRLMLIGVLFQVFSSLAVAALVYYWYRTGYTEAWMGWALLLPINFFCFVYFLRFFFGQPIVPANRQPESLKTT